MIGNIFSRRQAERFAQLVEEAGKPGADSPTGGPQHHARSGQAHAGQHARSENDALTPALATTQLLTEYAAEARETLRFSPEKRDALRQRLVAVATVQGIGVTADPDARETHHVRTHVAVRRPRSRLVLIGSAVAGVLAISGIAAASSSAVPGDPLYDVKRSTEQAQLKLAGSDVNSGQLYLQFARTRMSEAQAVVSNPASLVKVLNDMDKQTKQGVKQLDSAAVSRRDTVPLDLVNTFAANQRKDLLGLLSGMDTKTRQRTLTSLALVDQAAGRAEDLRTLLPCTAGKQVQEDSLGPLPLRCSAAGTPRAGQSHPGAEPKGKITGQPAPGTSAGASSGNGLPTAQGLPGGSVSVPGMPPAPSGSGSSRPTPTPTGNTGKGGLFNTIGKFLGGLF